MTLADRKRIADLPEDVVAEANAVFKDVRWEAVLVGRLDEVLIIAEDLVIERIANAILAERKRCAAAARNEITEDDDREAELWNAACEAIAKAIERPS